MSTYKVRVKVIASVSYEISVDAETFNGAENKAIGQWREHTPEDFQIDKGYIDKFDAESEQLTADCPRCGVEHPVPHDDMRLCHCAAIGYDPSRKETDCHGELIHTIPHPLDAAGNCTAPTWWHQDQDYCAACGVLEEQEDAANATA